MERRSRGWRPKLDENGELYDMDVSDWIRTEFRAADLGDKRLTDRLVQIGDELGSSPAESIPAACEDWASTKATYRFCDNDSVEPNEVLSAHKQTQHSRLGDGDELLVVSDTTYLTFPRHPAKEGLGDISSADIDVEGVKVHTSVGILPETQRMTGIIDQQVLIEDQQSGNTYDTNGKDESILLENGQEKWIRGDREATEWLPEDVRPIFVHDRGGDAFSLYTELNKTMDNTGFVVRANQNRRIHTDDGELDKLFDWSGDLPQEGRTTIEIQQGGGRQARQAELSIATGTCDLLPPRNDSAGKDPVTVNVVRIDEISESDDPIQWVLLTTESVEDFDDALTIIEYYRARWRIEDWHKALKTGCGFEERQLQTWERMEVLLSVYSVIAWKVLELRELARGEPSVAPEVLLSEAERAVLETKFPELSGQNGKAYAVSVAKLGGYLDRGSDPPPGWQTMWKGLQKLRMWAEGYELGAE
ncbi:IS4 family transposase [Halococcus dombrowskii]|uniref:IS4 family transposase n=1 Tax=Halococcus dombrowskii TaxID=179637 RepID=A0AAX3AL90_HALDO|nr:IS4 family transposase [Halococcus dombrowskii]UOO94938.1 IS4 family transposase [Halococcus dombrowskii]UOO94966.1 IS4 family transposase [Halococcus dombrowskii]UOO95844.1 IS4 family transposase [Halococcus dombrowskii]